MKILIQAHNGPKSDYMHWIWFNVHRPNTPCNNKYTHLQLNDKFKFNTIYIFCNFNGNNGMISSTFKIGVLKYYSIQYNVTFCSKNEDKITSYG